jgi:RNA-directed DNA polymerase
VSAERDRRDVVAAGLATAMLAGPWEHSAMRLRCRHALGRPRAPRWLDTLVAQVLAAFREPPSDGPRELAAYLQVSMAWELAWQHRRVPRIVAWTPTPTVMSSRPWPVTVLDDLAALASLLDLDQGELAWFADGRGWEREAAGPLRHYRWTSLRAPSGRRVVAAPKPRLKEIQRRLLRHVFAPIPLHDAAHGCVRGRSVRSALAPHAGAPFIMRADLAGFFASIPAGRVWELLRTAGYPEAVATTVTGLVTTTVPRAVEKELSIDFAAAQPLRRPHLPQGAPTSPAAANAVAFSLDRRLAGLALRFGAKYTRYVDDLTFSGGPSLRRARARFLERVDEIVRDEGFRLNARKTRSIGNAGRQALLGAVVNDRPTLPREERDALRAVLHNCAVRGWRTQQRDVPDLRAHLAGRIAWANGLDPVLGARLRAAFDAVDWG